MIEEYSHVTPDYHRYETKDMMTMEKDVQFLLEGFIIATKPRVVVEIGTWKGWTTRVIGAALQHNGVGQCIAFEIDRSHQDEVYLHTRGLPVTVYWEDANDHLVPDIDILLIDGSPDRASEYDHWYDAVKPGGLIFIHDALKGADTADWVVPMKPNILLRTPRGLAIVQKPQDNTCFMSPIVDE